MVRVGFLLEKTVLLDTIFATTVLKNIRIKMAMNLFYFSLTMHVSNST